PGDGRCLSRRLLPSADIAGGPAVSRRRGGRAGGDADPTVDRARTDRCGDVHFTERTRNSTLFVNPLMAMYFAVTVEGLAGRHRYLDRLERTVTIRQVSKVIEEFRHDVDRRIPRMFPH